MKNLGKKHSLFRDNTTLPGLCVLVLLITVNAILQPNMFSFSMFQINIQTLTPLILAAMAQALVIISGGIDLSVGATMSLFTILCARLFTDSLSQILIVLAFAFAAIIGVGALNGTVVGLCRKQPLISTLAISAVVLGISLIIMPTPGGHVPRYIYRIYCTTLFGFLPVSVVILLAAFCIWFILSRTSVYRYIYAIGDDEERAFYSGINVRRTRFVAYILSAIFTAMAGLCLLLMTATGGARSGSSYTLNSIAAAVIGGISVKGGKGSLWGAIIGAGILVFAMNIIFFAELGTFIQEFAKGLIILASLLIAAATKSRGGKTIVR